MQGLYGEEERELRFLVAEQLRAIGITPRAIVPEGSVAIANDQTVIYHNGAPAVIDRGRELGMTNRVNWAPA